MAGPIYAGTQNTDIGLAPLVNCPVCPVTDGIQTGHRQGFSEPGFMG